MNNATNNWENLFFTPMRDLLSKIIAYIPVILSALLLLIIGMILAKLLGSIAKKIFEYTRIDKLAEKIGLKKEMELIGLHFSFSTLIGEAVKWFFIILTLITVVDVLHITQVTVFLTDIALYIPNVLAAVIILSLGLIAGRFLFKILKDILSSFNSEIAANLVATIAKWAIYIFSILAALVQLKIAVNLIEILLTGIIALLALAGGLSFGLGGKDKAKEIIEDIGRRMAGKP